MLSLETWRRALLTTPMLFIVARLGNRSDNSLQQHTSRLYNGDYSLVLLNSLFGVGLCGWLLHGNKHRVLLKPFASAKANILQSSEICLNI